MKRMLQFMILLLIVNVSLFADDEWFEDDFFDYLSDEDFIEMFNISTKRPFVDLNMGINRSYLEDK